MRLLIRLIGLALAGYGAWVLYDKYGTRVKDLAGPAKDFSERARATADSTANTFRDAGKDIAESLRSSASEIDSAASDAGTAAKYALRENDREPTPSA